MSRVAAASDLFRPGDAGLGTERLHDRGYRLSRVQAAGDRCDHCRAGADSRARTEISRRSFAGSGDRGGRLRACAQARRGDHERRARSDGVEVHVSTDRSDAPVIDLAQAAGAPVARIYGEPLLELPHDLYIPPEALEVFLETFEGPLDLLLYLIRKQNINVLDIPMAELTRQYLGYVEMMRRTQLELAAEYLLMAAVLIEIKSRLLLPRPAAPAGEDAEPRAELVRRLLEYERMKAAARALDEMPLAEREFSLVRVWV